MEQPFLSVLIPIYQAEPYLEECLAGILAGDFSDFEIILIEDHSPDDAGRLCDRLAAQDPRIRAIHLPRNSGAGPARNQGLAEARGLYITFADADDRIDPALYGRIAAALKAQPADGAVWGVTEEYCNGFGRVTHRRLQTPAAAFCPNRQAVRQSILPLERLTLFGYQWNHFYRRALIEKYQLRFPHLPLYEDFFFNLAFIQKAGSLQILAETGYYYRKGRGNSLTSRFVADYFKLSSARIHALAALHRKWGLLDSEARRFLGARYLRYILSAIIRNCDPRSGLSHRRRAAFIREICQSPLYRELCRDQRGLARLLAALLERAPAAALMLGRAGYWIQ